MDFIDFFLSVDYSIAASLEYYYLEVVPYIMLAFAIPFNVVVIMCVRMLMEERGRDIYFYIFVNAFLLVAYDALLVLKLFRFLVG